MRFPESEGAKPAVTTGADPERWVEEHGDCLYRYALLRVRRPEIAEDLVQETFVVAVKTSGNFRGESSERSWLCGILKNKICDYFRKLGRETCFTDLEFLDDELSHKFVPQGFWNHEAGPLEWKPEAEVVMHRTEFWETFRDCLAKLPPAGSRCLYAAGNGRDGDVTDLRGLKYFAQQPLGDAPPRANGFTGVSGVKLV